MGKSRAEIQKAYRQRLKEKNNAEYLQREKDRMKRNYVPSAALSDNDRDRRNKKNRQKLRAFYSKKRQERLANQSVDLETSGYESGQACHSQERGRLAVRMNFQNNRRKGALVRWKRELSEANLRIRKLEMEREELRKRCRTSQRSAQRQKAKLEKVRSSKTSTEQPSTSEMTPNKQTEKIMTDANLSTAQKKVVKRSLLLSNVLVSEIKATKRETPRSKMKAVHNVISGKVMKKYKCSTYLSKVTGLCRHGLNKSESKLHQIRKSARMSVVKIHQTKVTAFMTREDNSRTQPGKQDAKRLKKGEKVQTHVLTDYLTNLYNKFKSENPNLKISFTSFCRSRPKYILTAAFSSRSSCLCTKHQNAALTIKALRREGFNISVNPEKGMEQIPSSELMKDKLGVSVVLGQWTRVEVEEKGKRKHVTKIVESLMQSDKFISHVENQMFEFDAHVNRVRIQYEQIRTLKEKLPKHEMIIQLDFAENYSCKSLEEVQSAYFNQTSVTLHPMVVYFKSDDDKLEHKSFIIVSDEMAHKSSTVIAFIAELMPILKEMDSGLKYIHYWSDSPTSQYRNKQMFDFIANHQCVHGVKGRWNYFEAGHGKGPCDGLGGTCKRMADEAMRSGKVIIQDAIGFYNWAQQSSMKNVTFRFVSTETCQGTDTRLNKLQLKPVKGTMKIHAVLGLGESRIRVKDVSCYCGVCISGQTCDSWRTEKTKADSSINQKQDEVRNTEPPQEETIIQQSGTKQTVTTDTNNEETVRKEAETITESPQAKTHAQQHSKEAEKIASENAYTIDEFVAAVYDGKWYIGKVADIDNNDHEIEVDFMEPRKQLFKWPTSRDLIWLNINSILCRIKAPVATGKTHRMFQLSENEKDIILEAFSKVMKK